MIPVFASIKTAAGAEIFGGVKRFAYILDAKTVVNKNEQRTSAEQTFLIIFDNLTTFAVF